tara:strand:+ start:655 stop:1908 length:1254 start_codon:yes stop_codon:yes gene_type:complete
MLQKLKIRFNDDWLLILLGLIIGIFPICFLSGSLIINLNTILACTVFIILCIKSKRILILKDKYLFLLIFLWITFLINLVLSTNFDNSLLRAVGFIRFIILAVSIKFFFENSSERLKRNVFTIWLLTIIIISFDLVFEYFIGHNILGFTSPMKGRLSGFLDDELKIGHLYLGFFLICSVTIFNLTQNNLILFMFVLFGIIISLIIGERANFLRFFSITVIFLLLFENKNFSKKILFLLILFSLAHLIIISNNNYKTRFYGQLIEPLIKYKTTKILLQNTVYGSNYDRGIKIFEKNKLFGVGINNFRIESGKSIYQNKDLIFNEHGASTHPHQIHIELLSETGVFGYLSFMVFIIISIFFVIKNFYKNKNLYVLASLLYFIFSLIPLLPTGSFFTTFGATIFWINYGLMINEKSYKSK